MEKKGIIIYNTDDGKVSVTLYAKDGSVWMNQNQMAELFDTSKQNIGQHVANILKENEFWRFFHRRGKEHNGLDFGWGFLSVPGCGPIEQRI